MPMRLLKIELKSKRSQDPKPDAWPTSCPVAFFSSSFTFLKAKAADPSNKLHLQMLAGKLLARPCSDTLPRFQEPH